MNYKVNTIVETEKKLQIAIQGYEASYHQIAAMGYYGKPIEIVPCKSFRKLVKKLENDETVDEGIMAIENSIAGSLVPNYHLLQKSHLSVTGEIYLHINHHLMTLPGQDINSLKEVHSHPMAILQCEKFFRKHPHIKLIETEDTALSARNIRNNNLKNIGAIASKMAADLYDLEVIQEHIETVKNNYTRFLILSRTKNSAPEELCNKASLHFRVSHKPGALVKALQVIADAGGNMSKVQSFPTVEYEWRYYFHIDIEFEHMVNYQEIIKSLTNVTEELKVLGVYHKGKTV
jgi:prephenate dehydratase